MKEFLVSVIVPSYNRAQYVRRCYDSVARQKHRPIEFILSDDASTDGTEEAVMDLPIVDGIRIRYIKIPVNQGVSNARNLAIKASNGEFIAFLDSDDVWIDFHLEKVLRIFDDSDADVGFSQADIRESPESPPSGRTPFGPTLWEEENLRECIYYYNFVLPSVTVVRKSFFEKIGYFDTTPQIQHAEDWDIFIRAAEYGLKFIHLRVPTAYYLMPEKASEEKRRMMIKRGLYCLEKHKNYPFVIEKNRTFTRDFYKAWLCMMLGVENDEARKLLFGIWRQSFACFWLFLAASFGLIVPAVSPFFSRLLSRAMFFSFRGARARHRKLRGFANAWD